MVTLTNTSKEKLHFPHIGTFDANGSLEVSEQDAEILLRNKALKKSESKTEKFKGTSRDRSMKAVEPE